MHEGGGVAQRACSRLCQVAGVAALVVAASAFAVGLAEMLTRVVAPQMLFRYPKGLYAVHPNRGYTLAPGFRGRLSTPEFSHRFVVGVHGFRDERIFRPKAPGTARILVLGDSFAVGVGVEAEQTFPRLLEEGLRGRMGGRRIEVVNGGVPSYSTREELLLLAEDGIALRPDLVVVAFFIGNDIADNGRPASARARVADGELVDADASHGALPVWLRAFLARHSHLYHLVWPIQSRLRDPRGHERARRAWLDIYGPVDAPEVVRAWRATDRWITHLGRFVARHDLPLAVLLVPDARQANHAAWEAETRGLATTMGDGYHDRRRPNREVAAMFRRRGIPVLDLLATFDAWPDGATIYFQRDGHWTAEGHRRVADVLGEFLLKERLVPVAGG